MNEMSILSNLNRITSSVDEDNEMKYKFATFHDSIKSFGLASII